MCLLEFLKENNKSEPSAQFANKVKGKVVGYVTGVILLVLGLAMIFINNLDKVNMVYLTEYLKLLGIYIGYTPSAVAAQNNNLPHERKFWLFLSFYRKIKENQTGESP